MTHWLVIIGIAVSIAIPHAAYAGCSDEDLDDESDDGGSSSWTDSSSATPSGEGALFSLGATVALTTVGGLSYTTTDLSSCKSEGTPDKPDRSQAKRRKKQRAFVRANVSSLRRDAAAGGGEYLSAYLTLLQCADQGHVGVGRKLQHDYRHVFMMSDVDRLIDTSQWIIANDPRLKRACAGG